MDVLAGLLLGVGLAAATGFRLFIPPLVLSMAAHYFGLPLPEAMHWLGTDMALAILAIATVVEIGAFYVPWLDNLLDTIAGPAAVIAGTLITSPFISDLDPFWQWTLALVAGGAAAGTMQSLTSLSRLSSTALTGGMGNFLLATFESIGSLLLSIAVIAFPVFTVVLILLAVFAFVKYRSRKSKLAADTAKALPTR